jgi:hypothetical protein
MAPGPRRRSYAWIDAVVGLVILMPLAGELGKRAAARAPQAAD